MRRVEFLERVGQQEEADPQEEPHVHVAFAAAGSALSGSKMRDIWRQFPSEPCAAFQSRVRVTARIALLIMS
jgi:hypothetical protein